MSPDMEKAPAANEGHSTTQMSRLPAPPPSSESTTRMLHRRADAARRLLPLDCGCRDPLPCTCTSPPMSDHVVDSYRDAAQHVLAQGLTPLLPAEVLRALWRRRGEDRRLAQHLHQITLGAVA